MAISKAYIFMYIWLELRPHKHTLHTCIIIDEYLYGLEALHIEMQMF